MTEFDKDELTGFYTETFLKAGIKKEILRAERYKRNLTFLLFDFIFPEKYQVDMFFPVFLRIAKEIQSVTRSLDIKIRKGNRVLIILPETSVEGATIAGEKVCNTISVMSFQKPGEEERFHVNVKFTVAEYPKDGKTWKDINEKLGQKINEEKTINEK